MTRMGADRRKGSAYKQVRTQRRNHESIFQVWGVREKLTLTGTPDGIERARVMWLKGHEHPVAILTTGSTLTAAPGRSGVTWNDLAQPQVNPDR